MFLAAPATLQGEWRLRTPQGSDRSRGKADRENGLQNCRDVDSELSLIYNMGCKRLHILREGYDHG